MQLVCNTVCIAIVQCRFQTIDASIVYANTKNVTHPACLHALYACMHEAKHSEITITCMCIGLK